MNPAYIAGGLLSGFGAAVQQDGIARREEVLRMLEENRADSRQAASETHADQRQLTSETHADQRAAAGDAAATTRQQADFTHQEDMADIQSGMLKDTVTRVGKDGQPHIIGLDKDGKEIHDYGVAPPAASAADSRLYQYDDGSGNTVWGTAGEARGKGAPASATEQKTAVATDEAADADAQVQAEGEANNHAGTFSSDSADFPGTGGDRKLWTQNRKKQILEAQKANKPIPPADYSGDGYNPGKTAAPAAAAAPAPSAAAPAATGGGSPNGRGVKAKPAGGNPQATSLPMKNGKPDVSALVKDQQYKLADGRTVVYTGAAGNQAFRVVGTDGQ